MILSIFCVEPLIPSRVLTAPGVVKGFCSFLICCPEISMLPKLNSSSLLFCAFCVEVDSVLDSVFLESSAFIESALFTCVCGGGGASCRILRVLCSVMLWREILRDRIYTKRATS
ncbi:hypothetical protein LS71_000630 [Helicobacter jaachi]|uniref:Uncharacterized protein n=1 Tax=Helicobacter jaachi TaxID=1677920 RepID=A0A4U8TBM1_9HELI|nr:hypothetical protein [Helicobacter jaachi]TLD97295.1 hypothetical protein LS71_000630 [Helicobacter jaachi]